MFKVNRFSISLGILASALLSTASHASAQQPAFTLPFQAQVGKVKLEPGTYRIEAPSAASVFRVIYLHGQSKVQATLPSTIDYAHNGSDRSYLELVNIGGTYFVDKFVSRLTGATYRFSVPKMPSRELLAKKTYIPVTGGAAD